MERQRYSINSLTPFARGTKLKSSSSLYQHGVEIDHWPLLIKPACNSSVGNSHTNDNQCSMPTAAVRLLKASRNESGSDCSAALRVSRIMTSDYALCRYQIQICNFWLFMFDLAGSTVDSQCAAAAVAADVPVTAINVTTYQNTFGIRNWLTTSDVRHSSVAHIFGGALYGDRIVVQSNSCIVQ